MSDTFADWESWHFGTRDNPYLKASEIEAAQREMPERFFKQEYEAAFLDDGGVVFRNVEAVCTGEHTHHAGLDGEGDDGYEPCYFGVDWGKENDYTCVSVMTRDGKQLWLERFNQTGWSAQRDRLAMLFARFRPVVILAEENSIGSVNLEALEEEGLPMRGFMTTVKSKTPLIDHLALAMEKREVTLLNDPILKHELMAYEMKRMRHGWSYHAPYGKHDDTVMATALSWWAAGRTVNVRMDWV